MSSYIIRGLGGTQAVNVDSDGDATASEIAEAANLADGTILRLNGTNVSGDTVVPDGATLVSAPAAAKHGLRK